MRKASMLVRLHEKEQDSCPCYDIGLLKIKQYEAAKESDSRRPTRWD